MSYARKYFDIKLVRLCTYEGKKMLIYQNGQKGTKFATCFVFLLRLFHFTERDNQTKVRGSLFVSTLL